MGKRNVEDIKRESRHLRGTIAETLKSDVDHFQEDEYQLLKFHGTYQQDDRDIRKGKDRKYIFMVRSRIPGGRLTAAQYLMHDRCADDFGGGTIRITSRQGFQMHHVVKGNLRDYIRKINESGIATWNACGDVCRNHMATPIPLDTPAHRDVQQLSGDLVRALGARSRAYAEIWLNGERLNSVPTDDGPEEEPVYGDTYLPRKFKIGAAVPPRNDVDIFTNDIGLAPHVAGDVVEGYTLWTGGGFGMTHGKSETYPVLAQPFAHVRRADLINVIRAIVTTQRDFGDRENRRRARLKYTIETMGFDRFREEVQSRVPDVTLEPPRNVEWNSVGDMIGWHEQGDGKLFVCIYVPDGRIADWKGGPQQRSAFRAIAERIGCPIRNTPNTNILFHDVEPAQRAEIDAILKEFKVEIGDHLTDARQTSQACVALPTCGLALAESERVFQELMDQIDTILRELGMEHEPLLVRMTGCPNGCARPYNADIAFVGRSPGKYALYIGGSHRGDRLAVLYLKTVAMEEIPDRMRALLTEFRGGRAGAESFTDWWGRTHTDGEQPHPSQFHEELQERAERLAAEKSPTPE
jgi:sulfite reductase beta subunit-like hemoprotein